MLPWLRRRRDDEIDPEFLSYLEAKRDRLVEEFCTTPRNLPTVPSLATKGTPAPQAGTATARHSVERGSQSGIRPAAAAGWIIAGLMVLVVVSNGGDSTASDEGGGDSVGQQGVAGQLVESSKTPPEPDAAPPEGDVPPPDRRDDERSFKDDTGDTDTLPEATDTPDVGSEPMNDVPADDPPVVESGERPGVKIGNLPPGSVVVLPGGCTVTVDDDGGISLDGPGCGDVEFGLGDLSGLLHGLGALVTEGGESGESGVGDVLDPPTVDVDGGGDVLMADPSLDLGETGAGEDQPCDVSVAEPVGGGATC